MILSSVLILVPLAICDPENDPIDPQVEYEAIMKRIGFKELDASVQEGMKDVVVKAIENTPKLKEKIDECEAKGEITPEDREELLALFKAAYNENKSVYRAEIKKVMANVPREMVNSLKDKIVAVWDRIKNFFKRAWNKLTGKSKHGLRQKRVLIIGMIFWIAFNVGFMWFLFAFLGFASQQ